MYILAVQNRTSRHSGKNILIAGLRTCVDTSIIGSLCKEILKRGHNQLSTYGVGREFSRKQWQQLARQLVGHGLLRRDMTHGSLKVTEQGRAVLRGKVFMGTPLTAERAVGRATAHDYDEALFDRLRAVRLELARQEDVPAYIISHDSTLREIAIYYPQSRDSLAQITGINATKLERFGDTFLAVIQTYCREQGITERPKPEAPARPARVPTGGRPRREQVTEMYIQGEDPASIAQNLNIQWNSVMLYLWQSVLDGVRLDGPALLALSRLPADERQAVFSAFNDLGVERLRLIYEALQETVPYEELHILRLYYVLQQPSISPVSDATRHEVQQAILRCVSALSGELPRSGVAKLLVGSDSARVADYITYPEYSRFSSLPRHIVMAEVDRLLAEGKIWLDEERHLRI